MKDLTAKQKIMLNNIYNGEVEDYSTLDKRTVNALVSKGMIGVTEMDGEIADIGVLDTALRYVEDETATEIHSSDPPQRPQLPTIKEQVVPLPAINADNILSIKEKFDNWKPADKTEAIKMKYLKYLLSNKNIDAECNAMFDEIADLGTEYIDTETGLKLTRRKRAGKKIYNESEDIMFIEMEITDLEERIEAMTADLRAQIEEKQEELKEAKDAAGFTQEDDTYSYAVKI